MHILCCICNTVRGEHVSEYIVCIIKAENVLQRKEIERLNEYVTELRVNKWVETLKREVGKVSELLEKRKDGSIRRKDSRIESMASPSQEAVRGWAKDVANRVTSDLPEQKDDGRGL